MQLRAAVWTIRRNGKNVVITLVCTMILCKVALVHRNNSLEKTSPQDYDLSFPSYDDMMDPSIHKEAHEMHNHLKKRSDSKKRQASFKKEFDYFGSYETEHWAPKVKNVSKVRLYPGLEDKVKTVKRDLRAHIEDPEIRKTFDKKPTNPLMKNKVHNFDKNADNDKLYKKNKNIIKGIPNDIKTLKKPNQEKIEMNTTHQFGSYISDHKDILGLHQEDPRALEFAKKNMYKPSTLPYNITGVLNGIDERYLSASQEYIMEAVDQFFITKNHSVTGKFFEAGAYDGEFLSNTLWLERLHNWRGLLVEPNPESFGNLLKKHRKALAINCCLSTTSYVTTMTLNLHVVNDEEEKLNDGKENYLTQKAKKDPTDHFWKSSSRKRHENATKVGFHEEPLEVLCLPLYTLLSAANLTRLHFLSLDVEYVEMGVLRSLPWDKLDIQVLVIEHLTEEDLPAFMEERGYHFYSNQGEDWIFVNKKYVTIKEKV